MIFGHDHHYDVATMPASQGPTPLWCKVCAAAAFAAIILVATHCVWGRWL